MTELYVCDKNHKIESTLTLVRLFLSFPDLLLFGASQKYETTQFMPGGHSDTVPPDPIPNSEVKRISGDGSVGIPHARVAHCQAPN